MFRVSPLAMFILVVALCLGLYFLLVLDDVRQPAIPQPSEPAKQARPQFKGTPIVIDPARTATLTGRVSVTGKVPSPVDLREQFKANGTKDFEHCLKGRTSSETWLVGPEHGLANVVVWLRESEGKYYQLPADAVAGIKPVVLDSPYCAFEPHVAVLWPDRFEPDTRKLTGTGQTFTIKNSAPIAHVAGWSSSTGINSIPGRSLSSGPLQIDFHSGPLDRAGGEDLIRFVCNIHPWMSAYVWVFDHPFAAVSSGGQADFGTYRIEGAPTGVALELVYWHESLRQPKVLRNITLQPEVKRVDFNLSADE
ncbi:MAG: hypothetical protein AB7K24_31735 [Gemmataceae bacterium]